MSIDTETLTTNTVLDEGCAEVERSGETIAPPDDHTLATLAKALGHPARLRILRLLAARETCVTGDVVAELPLAQSTVSEHLRILKKAGLVQVDTGGTRSAYCVSRSGLALLKAGIAEL